VYATCLAGTTATTRTEPASDTVPADATRFVTASCSSGELLTGGGWAALPQVGVWVNAAEDFVSPPDSWRAQATNRSGTDATLNAYAVCLQP
jgi:hypothetical protein